MPVDLRYPIGGLADTLLALTPDWEEGVGLWAERLAIDMPLEFYVRRERDGLRIELTAPSQTVETTILPVFHRLQLVMEEEGGGAQYD